MFGIHLVGVFRIVVIVRQRSKRRERAHRSPERQARQADGLGEAAEPELDGDREAAPRRRLVLQRSQRGQRART